MNFILWIIIGGILGWIASMIMRTNAQQGLVLNIIVGIVGALVAGLVLTPLFRHWHHQSKQFQPPRPAGLIGGCHHSLGDCQPVQPRDGALVRTRNQGRGFHQKRRQPQIKRRGP